MVAAHGIRGAVRLDVSNEHLAFLAEMPTLDVGGRQLTVRGMRGMPGRLIVEFEGVDDRNSAESLRGAVVSARRDQLPPPGEDEYFLADLEGCVVEDLAGARVGRVTKAVSLPANVVLTIALEGGGEFLAPLARDAVPMVDVEGARIVVDRDFLGLDT